VDFITLFLEATAGNEIKILDIHMEGLPVREQEVTEITRLVNEGWSIVTAGGFGGLVLDS
jgi:hypothetical protein